MGNVLFVLETKSRQNELIFGLSQGIMWVSFYSDCGI